MVFATMRLLLYKEKNEKSDCYEFKVSANNSCRHGYDNI